MLGLKTLSWRSGSTISSSASTTCWVISSTVDERSVTHRLGIHHFSRPSTWMLLNSPPYLTFHFRSWCCTPSLPTPVFSDCFFSRTSSSLTSYPPFSEYFARLFYRDCSPLAPLHEALALARSFTQPIQSLSLTLLIPVFSHLYYSLSLHFHKVFLSIFTQGLLTSSTTARSTGVGGVDQMPRGEPFPQLLTPPIFFFWSRFLLFAIICATFFLNLLLNYLYVARFLFYCDRS